MSGNNGASAGVLEGIIERTQAALTRPRAANYEDDLRARAGRRTPLDFRAALEARPAPALVAECKRRSPVRGALTEDYDVARQSRAYAAGGAAAISVLTNPDFWGSLEDLGVARAAVSLPLLRKDFVIDELQLLEARAWGADAVLLIARVLSAARLADLAAAARELGLQTLVEVHDVAEVPGALAARPDMLGVNTRDLATFEVDPDLVRRVAGALPPGLLLVAESGLHDRAGVVAAATAGASAVLVGEALMRSPNPEVAVRELVGEGQG